jgi:hypothetical protein
MKNKNRNEASQKQGKNITKSIDANKRKQEEESHQRNDMSKTKDKSDKFPNSNNIVTKKIRNVSNEKRSSLKTVSDNNTTKSTLASKNEIKLDVPKKDDKNKKNSRNPSSIKNKTCEIDERKDTEEKFNEEFKKNCVTTEVNDNNIERKKDIDLEVINSSSPEDVYKESNSEKEDKFEWVTLIDNNNVSSTNTEGFKENLIKTEGVNEEEIEMKKNIKENKQTDFTDIKKESCKTPMKDLIERMEKFSQKKAEKLELKRKKIADEIVSQVIGVPQINEKSKRLVIKDFTTRQEDYKTNSSQIKNKLFQENEEKIRRELTPDNSYRKKGCRETFQTFENHINFQFQWDEERRQRIEQIREREVLDISRECTFTPKISKRSDIIAKTVNKDNVIERLYNQDRLKKRNRYLITTNEC